MLGVSVTVIGSENTVLGQDTSMVTGACVGSVPPPVPVGGGSAIVTVPA